MISSLYMALQDASSSTPVTTHGHTSFSPGSAQLVTTKRFDFHFPFDVAISSFQQVKHFLNDGQSEHAHLTSTLADKADMAHVLHDRSHKREVVEAATLLATLALLFVGVVGYIHVLAEFSSDEVKALLP
ncbi:hypothetical protein CF319_g8813 [Tilletia indica]|nr:hypothetical protein CF319_g8813 [Tilletia indica]